MDNNYKNNFTVEYATDMFLEGNINLPYMLLRSYAKLGINEIEFTLILHLIAFKQLRNNFYPTTEDLAGVMSLDAMLIKNYIATLIEKDLIEVEQKFDYEKNKWVANFNLNNIFDRLAEIWALEKMQEKEEEEKQKELSLDISNDMILGELYRTFEKEFGRFLSPIESNQLSEWYKLDNHSPEIIKEALKRAVLRGIYNFKYIDSILRDWAKNKITTIKQANEFEEKFVNRKESLKGKKIRNKDNASSSRIENYKDLYLNRG